MLEVSQLSYGIAGISVHLYYRFVLQNRSSCVFSALHTPDRAKFSISRTERQLKNFNPKNAVVFGFLTSEKWDCKFGGVNAIAYILLKMRIVCKY